MSLGEFDIIARYFAGHDERGDVLLGVGDDAAVLQVDAGRRLVVAMDTIVAGVHFPPDTAAVDVGYRALAVNLSDLAAMGAVPSWMTLSLSMPRFDEHWLGEFATGLLELARAHDVVLVGGDTVRGPLAITLQIAGTVEAERWLTRADARCGDAVFVSGVPGEAAAGLATLQGGMCENAAVTALRRRFLRPEPRVALGRLLRPFASAAMDISDGLLTDLDKLCAASGCGAQIDLDALPISVAARELFGPAQCVDYALAGGDDYEIIFTIPVERLAEFSRMTLPVQCTQIGVITAGRRVECLRNQQPVSVQRRGYDHFARGPHQA